MCTAQAGIAQSVEHFTRNEGVVSSSLISSSVKNSQNPYKQGLWLFLILNKIIQCANTGPVLF